MTTSTRETLRAEAGEVLSAARTVAEKAYNENRAMTNAEKLEYDSAMTKGRQLIDQIKQRTNDQDLLADVKSLAQHIGDPIGHTGHTGNPWEATARQIKGREWAAQAAAKMEATATAHGVKALVSGSVEVPNPISVGVVAKPDNPTRLIDMIVQRERLNGNEFTYLRQTVRTNNAAPVADFGTKPTSVFTFAEVEDRARVIAHLSEPIPERYFEDHLSLLQVLDSEMFRGVSEAVEAQVISGAGTGENLTGILTVAGTTPVAYTSSLLVTLRKARTALANLEEIPTAWAFNPADAETIDLERDSTGQFLTGLDNVFGQLPRLVSKGVPAGTAILADWNQLRLLVRDELRLDADRSGTNFTKNQVVLRAEGRFGVAVLRPQAFAIVDLTA